jgi:hypothetical protein
VEDPTGLAIAVLAARGVCAGIFLWAGASKLRDAGFAAAIANLTGVGPRFASAAARAVPPAELVVGFGLLLPPLVPLAGSLGAGLLGLFSLVLIRALVRGTTAPCSCFGTQTVTPVSWLDLGRNLLMTVAILPSGWPGRGFELGAMGGLPLVASAVPIGAAAVVVCVFVLAGNLRMIAGSDAEAGRE